MKLKTCIYCCLVFMFLCTITLMCGLLYNRIKPKGFKEEYEDIHEKNVLHVFQQNAETLTKIKNIKKTIMLINEQQYAFNYTNASLKVNITVFVIYVCHNITYLNIFLESIHKIWEVSRSLMIFAHDYYDDEINSAIRNVNCAKVVQIFYPYSTQLHPNVYPGDDSRFCEELTECIDSRKRDPILVHTKLFWWWVANQVFDYVGVLKNYDGCVYFLETAQYLTSDVVHMAKMLEHLQPTFCPECQILSLGAGVPRPEMYYPENINLIVSVWGRSNYSNLGIGFNRTTWEVIKGLKIHFCRFKDSSWERSLRYLALKMHHQRLSMLAAEGPRFFPTTGCGAFRTGTDCDLTSNYHDILKFIPKIEHGRLARVFKLKYDGFVSPDEVEPRGEWGDARDVELCMFFSTQSRRA